MSADFQVKMDFALAWNLYLKTANLDGLVFNNSAPRYAKSLTEIDGYDVLLLDGFGVLNLGGIALPGMVDEIETLMKAGKGAYILTNGATMPKQSIVVKYQELGYSGFDEHSIITSRDALINGLTQFDKAMHWALSPADGDNLDLGIQFTFMDELADFNQVDGFILTSTLKWQDRYATLLYDALKAHPRPVLCANPDITAPTEYGFTTEPGFYARMCAEIEGTEVYYFGKPDLNAYECALTSIRQDFPDIDPKRILMVGDSPHTDILGGARAGLSTALMTDWGFFAERDAVALLNEAQIRPDWIIGS